MPRVTWEALWPDLVTLMRDNHVDHTSFFRALGAAARGDAEPARRLFLDLPAFDDWVARWRALAPDAEAMDRVNPVYVPRNHLVEEALDAATADDLGLPYVRAMSGAGHDAMAIAAVTDVAMLFTRCGNGGISHNPLETMTADDADLAAQVLLDFLRRYPGGAA